jgi:hypothetical protein
MSIRDHLPVDSTTSPIAWVLNTSTLNNKSPSARPQVSRTRYAPSDVPSASKMKQRISEVFGSSKNIVYSGQAPYPGVPETSIPAHDNNILTLQQTLPRRYSSLLTARRSLLSSSPSKAAARRRRRRVRSSLPPSSPPSSSGIDETEDRASKPRHRGARNPEPEDPYGLLRGHHKFSRLRHGHPPQKDLGAPRSSLGCLENLSPLTPCANNGLGSGGTSRSKLFARSSLELTLEATHHAYRDRGGNGNRPASGGGSETLSGLLIRLPRGRRQPHRQRQDSCATSVSTTIEPPKTAAEKQERGKQRKKKRAGDEASHLKGQVRVVRNTINKL